MSQSPLNISPVFFQASMRSSFSHDDDVACFFHTRFLTLADSKQVCSMESQFVLCLIFKKHHFLRFDLVSKNMHNYLKKLFKHFSPFQLLIHSLCETRLSSYFSQNNISQLMENRSNCEESTSFLAICQNVKQGQLFLGGYEYRCFH